MNIEPGKTAGGGGKLIPNPKLKLPSPFHEVMRFKHLSERTETAYWQWVVRFLKFHRHGGEWRHPRVLPASAMAEFLSDLSVRLGLGRCGAILEPSRPSSAKGQASGHSTEDSEEHL